jgi:hypothetical protein
VHSLGVLAQAPSAQGEAKSRDGGGRSDRRVSDGQGDQQGGRQETGYGQRTPDAPGAGGKAGRAIGEGLRPVGQAAESDQRMIAARFSQEMIEGNGNGGEQGFGENFQDGLRRRGGSVACVFILTRGSR